MTAAFFLMLREGLEAALIVGIIAAYLVKIGRRDGLPAIGAGVGLALAVSIGSGFVVASTIGSLPLAVRATLEGLTAFAAVVVLTWMLFWMRRAGRAIKGDLERGVDAALAGGSIGALAGLAFVAVLREGLETVLFLVAIGSSAGEVGPLLAASFAGLAVAVAIGWAIFAAGVRIDLRRFFTVTGVVLIFVSGGLIAYGLHEFTETGLVPVTPTAFDLGSVLPETSPLGALLAGLFGYRSAPTILEVVAYLAYVLPVLALFTGLRRPARPVSAATAVMVIALLAAGCGPSAASGSAPAGASAPAGGEVVEVAATEYKFDPSAITVPAGSVSFHVTNSGAEEHEFEVFSGETVVDEIEGLVPGLDRTLTVTLEAGDYTFVCKLPGHEEAGMKGTITVTAS
jgi:high-affinity iron transporter